MCGVRAGGLAAGGIAAPIGGTSDENPSGSPTDEPGPLASYRSSPIGKVFETPISGPASPCANGRCPARCWRRPSADSEAGNGEEMGKGSRAFRKRRAQGLPRRGFPPHFHEADRSMHPKRLTPPYRAPPPTRHLERDAGGSIRDFFEWGGGGVGPGVGSS